MDLHGVGRSDWCHQGPVKGTVAPTTTQFHWEDPSLSTESSRGEKPSACFSVLGVAGSSLGIEPYKKIRVGPPQHGTSLHGRDENS